MPFCTRSLLVEILQVAKQRQSKGKETVSLSLAQSRVAECPKRPSVTSESQEKYIRRPLLVSKMSAFEDSNLQSNWNPIDLLRLCQEEAVDAYEMLFLDFVSRLLALQSINGVAQ